MSDIVIKVENLSKQYRIGSREGYKTFRESLVDAAKAPFSALRSMLSAPSSQLSSRDDTIWALRDVSFEIKRGEVVGIIGRNGAGKSTLLKILSQITEPTKGRVELRGRVGSLLEVGTGFHPELSGHENVYLYGAILGMDRYEVTRKFDEIVAFAGLEKFIETPVKRYSSGMYMRLAFAVAAHMETEILLVDEVLAVGDAVFQKKCLGKMEQVSEKGRTVLFVSHNMAAIQRLCPRAIVLVSGEAAVDTDATNAVLFYLKEATNVKEQGLIADVPREASEYGKMLKVVKIAVLDAKNQKTDTLRVGEPFGISIESICIENVNNVSFVVGIDTAEGSKITTVASDEKEQVYNGRKGETLRVATYFNDLFLNSGRFSIRVGARSMNIPLDLVKYALVFEVTDSRYPGVLHFQSLHGLVRSSPTWKLV